MLFMNENDTAGNGTAPLANRDRMVQQVGKIEAALNANTPQEALVLSEEGLNKARMWTDVEGWEREMQLIKSLALRALGREEDARACERLALTLPRERPPRMTIE